jgi:serine/threonine protein kinase
MLVGIPPFYNDNLKLLYQNIERGNLKLPKYLSSEAKKFLAKILHKDPKKRPSLDQIKKDAFFAEIDWAKLARRELVPPTIMTKPKEEEKGRDKEQEELEQLFESGDSNTVCFEDEDYEEHNRRHNRVKNYSFSIGMPR